MSISMTHITTRYHVDVPGLGNHLDSHRYSRDVQNWSPSLFTALYRDDPPQHHILGIALGRVSLSFLLDSIVELTLVSQALVSWVSKA